MLVVECSAEEVGVEGHGFGKGVVAVAGDKQVVLLAAELRIATWDLSLIHISEPTRRS